mmetsp:Transcript_4918/g.8757  ORF Transcript_4918/g.8757 Transcript_4918/m.8757 type:complete len:98 (+) Transcript_4918:268-561(+)
MRNDKIGPRAAEYGGNCHDRIANQRGDAMIHYKTKKILGENCLQDQGSENRKYSLPSFFFESKAIAVLVSLLEFELFLETTARSSSILSRKLLYFTF